MIWTKGRQYSPQFGEVPCPQHPLLERGDEIVLVCDIPRDRVSLYPEGENVVDCAPLYTVELFSSYECCENK